MREKLEKIEVRTVPNGYEMKYDGTDFFYFSKMDLLAGFMAHIGAGNSNIMDKGTIMSTIFNIMLGEKYAKDVDDLKNTVARLEKKYSDRLDELKHTLSLMTDALAEHERMKRRITEISDLCRDMKESYKEALSPYEDYNRRIAMLEGQLNIAEDRFSKAGQKAEKLLKEMKDTYADYQKDERRLTTQYDMQVVKLTSLVKREEERQRKIMREEMEKAMEEAEVATESQPTENGDASMKGVLGEKAVKADKKGSKKKSKGKKDGS